MRTRTPSEKNFVVIHRVFHVIHSFNGGKQGLIPILFPFTSMMMIYHAFPTNVQMLKK